MSKDLMLRLQMELADKVSAPLKNVTKASQFSAQALKANRDRLRELARDNSLIQKLKKQQEAFKVANTAMRESQTSLIALKHSGSATAAQIKAQTALVKKNAAAFDTQKQKLVELRNTARNNGIQNIVTAERQLAAEMNKTTQAIRQQETVLRRMDQLRSQRNQSLGTAAAIAGTGMGMRMAGQRGLNAGRNFLMPGFDFDVTMSRVQALTRLDADSAELQALRQQARDLGATTNFSATDAAQGQAFLAMAGFKPQDIMGAMPGLLDMSLAGDIELARTADIASNISSGFGIDASEMMRVADVLTSTFTNANVDMEMLGQTMQYMAPIARAAGVSFEDSAALAAMLGNVGIQGSSAGTQLRAMLTSLSTKGADKLADLGIQASDAEGNLRDVTELFFEMDQATRHLGTADRLSILNEVFDQRAMAGASELLEQIASGKLQEFSEMLRNSQGAAAQTARIMNDNLHGDLKELESGWEEFGNLFWDQLKTDLRQLTQYLTQFIGYLNAWAKANPELVATLAKVTAVILALITGIGSLLISVGSMFATFALTKYMLGMLGIKFNGLIPIILNLGKVLFRFGLTLLTNPIFLAIAAIATAAYLIYDNWDTIVWFFQDIWDQLKTAFEGGIGGISAFILNWSPLGLFYKVFAVVMDYFGITLPENFTTFAGNILGTFGGIIVGAGTTIKDFFVTAFNDVLNWFTVELPEKFLGIGTMIMDGLKNGITGAIGGVKDAIVGVADGAIGWFQNILDMHSPSRVFMAAGMNISEGAALGITKGQPLVERASIALADTSKDAFVIDRRSPVRASAANSAGSAGMGGDNITIHIHATGGDPQEIARAVEEALNRRDREKRARNNSGYFDA